MPMEMSLHDRMREAMAAEAVDRFPCTSKEEALERMRRGIADIMAVRPRQLDVLSGRLGLDHQAVRFHDRLLGEEARRASLLGFGLMP